MSFEKPERLLTKEEWRVLAQAAQDKARNYLNSSVTYYRDGETGLANYYAEEDLDKKGKEYVHD